MGIKIYVKDAAELSVKECIALGKMFMHLGGCNLEKASEIKMDTAKPESDKYVKGTDPKYSEVVYGNTTNTTPPPVTINEVAQFVVDAAKTLLPPITTTAQTDVTEEEEDLILPAGINKFPGVDAEGIRWDGRIHAKNGAKTAKGTWKLGRNLSPTFIKSVKAELKKAPVPLPPSAPTSPIPLPPAPLPLPVPLPAAAEVNPYDVLVARIQAAVKAGKLQIAAMTARVKAYGL